MITRKKLKGAITKTILIKHGLAYKNDLIKILGRGELTSKIDITVDAFSRSAKEAIQKLDGTATIID